MPLEVFTQINFITEFIRLNWLSFTKMTNLLFDSPFGGHTGNVRTSSIARWKARGRLPIRNNWTFFASSYGWDVISKYWSKSALFQGGGSLWAQILGRSRRRSPPIVGIRKLECFCYLTVKIAWSYLHSCGYNTSVWQTDRRTDGIAVAITALCIASNAAAL